MRIVLIPDRLDSPAEIEQQVLGADTEILTPKATHTDEIPAAVWASCDAILAWHEIDFTKDVIGRLENCRVIVRVGVGYDNVDLKAAGEKGIAVCNVPDYGTNDVADHAVAMMMSLFRNLPGYDSRARDGKWTWEDAGELRRITGSSLGIIGLGRIGSATAIRAQSLGMRVLFHDPYKQDGYDKVLGIERVQELAELLGSSDAVSLHVPLTEETKGMVCDGFFERLKPGAILVNTSRGKTMDLDSVERALRRGVLRGAGLDVLPEEPPDMSHPLIRAWKEREEWLEGRMILTPHAAFYNAESYAEMRRKAAEEAARVLAGSAPRNCVNGQYLRREIFAAC